MLKPKAGRPVSLPDTTTIEESLLVLPAIRGVRVIMDDNAEIGEIHVIATPRRSPKKIVRDIESFLLVQYGYRIDYRRISLVQVVANVTTERMTLGRVEQVQLPEGAFIEVELLNGEQKVKGIHALSEGAAVAAGKATVMALNAFFAPQVPLAIAGIEETSIGARQVVTAYVTYQGSSIEHVLGTTFVRNSVPEAAARAVLAATNRRLASWLPEQPVELAELVLAS